MSDHGASTNFPVPTPAETADPSFDIQRWSLLHGVCPYHGGAHDFAGMHYCRLCREDRTRLVRMSRTHRIFEIDED